MKDEILSLMPNVQTLVIDIPPCPCPLDCPDTQILHKTFSRNMNTLIGKDVEVLFRWDTADMNDSALGDSDALNPSRYEQLNRLERNTVLWQWRNRGLQAGERVSLCIVTPRGTDTTKFREMSKRSQAVLNNFYSIDERSV